MNRIGSGPRLQIGSAITRWTLCGVFVIALALSQASATVITDTFLGWPPDPFTQQDKTWGGWTDVLGNVSADFTTLITTRSGIVLGQDLHTFSMSASFLPNTTYEISYYIMVNTTGVSMTQASSGVITTIPGATITTTFAESPTFSITTTSSSGLQTLPNGPYTLLTVTDTITTGSSDITGFSNSFLENVTAPEPGTLALLGSGILAGAALLRRSTV